MQKKKFKIASWETLSRNRINIKEQIFFALCDKRYLNLLSSNAKADVLGAMNFNQYKYFLKKNKMYKKIKKEYSWDSDSTTELKVKKLKELKPKKEFVAIKTNPQKALKQALGLLNTAFTLNKNVKKNAYQTTKTKRCGRCGCLESEAIQRGYECLAGYFNVCYFESTFVDYNLRDSEYKQKTKIIKKVINLIKNNLLPIKYGKNSGIIYFEYLGRQVSFHDPKDQIKNCKKFNGVWSRVPNKKIPFSHLTKTKN